MERIIDSNGMIKRELSFATLTLQIIPVGEDYQIILSGGEKPHIGCSVVAIPRPSLTGDGHMSATSSVLNVVGHKDEFICRRVAEAWAAKTGRVVCVSGGFHVDGITREQIQELMEAIDEIL